MGEGSRDEEGDDDVEDGAGRADDDDRRPDEADPDEADPRPAREQAVGPPGGDRWPDPLRAHAGDPRAPPAVLSGADGRTWTYDEVDAIADRTAGRLAAAGVDAGDRVAIVLPDGPAIVGLVHGAMRLGAALAPLDQRHRGPLVRDRLEALDPALVVCGPATRELVTDAPCPVETVDPFSLEPLEGLEPAPIKQARWTRGDPMLLLGTSGSTGTPKTVALTAGNLLASATASAFRLGLGAAERWLCALPMSHMGGIAPLYRAAWYGTAVVVPDRSGAAGGDARRRRGGDGAGDGAGAGESVDAGTGFDPDRLELTAHRRRVTGLSLVPTMLTRFLDGGYGLPDSLRVLLLGGGPIPPSLVERCTGRGIPVHPTYGATETASQVTTALPAEAADDPGTVGRPLALTSVTVVDDDGEPVEAGTAGEVVVDGPTVMAGYVNDPEATREAMGPHGYHTGDLGVLDEVGRLRIVGRAADRIVTGGENVDPGMVAAALEAHPAVDRAAVVGVADPTWGEAVVALVAVGEGRGAAEGEGREADDREGDDEALGPPVSGEALRAFCRERLRGFEVPKTVVVADRIPETASGTVDRERVRGIVAEVHAGGREDTDGEGVEDGAGPADEAPPEDGSDDAA